MSEALARSPVAEKPHRMWWTLVITSIALFMVTLDNLVVTNALPTIQRDFNASIQDLEWSVNAYTLTFAVLLLTGAALGDRFGRRKMFIIGLAIFTASSAACALATNIAMLDAFRAVQGLGGAIVTPLTLTILSQAFPEQRRGLALGIWSGISGFAVALGPVIGGAIVTGIAWEWIFWVNVPVGIIAIPLALGLLRETRGPNSRLDLVGVALASVGLFGIVWGIIRGSDIGWTEREVLVALGGGAIVTLAFILWELRSRAPMLPMRFFRNRTFAAVNTASLLMYFGLFGAIFLLVQFLQVVQGYSALKAGVATLPSTGMPIFIAPIAGALSDKIGGKPLIAAGMTLQTIALGWMAYVITPGMSYWTILPPFVIFGIGMGLFFPPVAYLVLGSVPREAAGQASGANNAIRELGGVFGVGVLSTIFASYGSYRSGQAYTDGLIPAVWVGTAVVGLGTVASLFIPGRKHAIREVEATVVDAQVVDAPEPTPSASAPPPPPPPTLPPPSPAPLPVSESLEPVWNLQPDHRHDPQQEEQPETFTCPVCMGHGWFPFEPPRDPGTRTCPRCLGHGKVLTGSHVEGHIVRECPECEAHGYIDAREAAVPVAAGNSAPPSQWPGSEWDPQQEVWKPPAGQSPPWTGAVWDESRGTYQ